MDGMKSQQWCVCKVLADSGERRWRQEPRRCVHQDDRLEEQEGMMENERRRKKEEAGDTTRWFQ